MVPVISGLAPEHTDKILSVLRSSPSLREAVLFGSRAKGNFREGSDIDIAVKGVDTKERDRLALAYDDLFLPWTLDLVIYESIEAAELKDHIDRVGLSLFKRP